MSYPSKAEWELIHWPVKCRGNFIRLIFAECGVPFKEISGWDVTSSLVQSTRNGTQQYDASFLNMSMAPPYIRKIGDIYNNTMISQCVIITQYLSELYGLRPKSDLQHAQCGMIISNCNDLFTEIYQTIHSLRDGFISKQEFINDFFLCRFPKWMDIIEQPLKKKYKNKNKKYYFENRITQSDLCVYNIMDGLNEWLNDKLFKKYVLDKHEYLHSHYDLMRKTSVGIQKLTKYQKDIGYKWWPYDGFLRCHPKTKDCFNIIGSRTVLLKSNL